MLKNILTETYSYFSLEKQNGTNKLNIDIEVHSTNFSYESKTPI